MDTVLYKTSVMPCTHGGPLWFNCGGHFDFRLISSCNILIFHRALGSLNMKTYVCIPKASFCDNWFAHILQKYFGGHLGLYIFHQWDSLGIYYVVFYKIFVYSEQK